jgi:hypothetical protein
MDEDTRELLERRLAERVESRVRGRLFAFYAAVGSIVLGVIGFFGYNLVTGLESRAEGYAQSAVAPAVEAANAAADEARARAAEIAARLDALEDFQGRREEALLEGERQVQRNQGRVKELADEIEDRLKDIVTQLQETQAEVQATRDQLRAAQSELSVQQARVRETAGIGNFAELAANLAELSEQVALLDEQLREIRARTAGAQGYETPLADAGRIETIQRVASAQAQAIGYATAEPLPEPVGDAGMAALPPASVGEDAGSGAGGGPNTVYFQFTGIPREIAEGISARLAPLGFDIPGEERIGSAAGLHEVRYFFEADGARAQRLAEAANEILRQQGYRAEVTARDLTGYSGQKPRPGTLELWLEPVSEG